jgi:16S rRNA (cytidine1402-2'-O)-methyltransferase
MPAQPDPSGTLPGGLYLVATPIGNARDITLRALDILRSADVLAAEDTRTLRRLLEIHGIALGDRPLIAYNDHNGAGRRPVLLAHLEARRSVALTSDAGTPAIADPGFVLVREALAKELRVEGAPGPSAVISALIVSGLPTDRFLFAGFLPTKRKARLAALEELATTRATLILYESPKRCLETIKDIGSVFGTSGQAALCRELTKKFEDVRRGTLADLETGCRDDPPRGEVVLVVDRRIETAEGVDLEQVLGEAMQRLSIKDAVSEVASALSLPRRDVYQTALKLDRAP